MNAYINFRSGSMGNLSPSTAQRQQAAAEVTSNLRAKVQGIMRAMGKAAKEDEGSGTPTKQPDELGRDAFLTLLITQMQYQDPLDPVDNTEMIAQLAQFSALEQMTQMNEGFEDLSERVEFMNGNIDQLNFISAQGLLGRWVEGVTADGEEISGRVESVHLNGSLVVLTVDGQLLPMSGVISVNDREPEPDDDSDDAAGDAEAGAAASPSGAATPSGAAASQPAEATGSLERVLEKFAL